MGKTTATTEPSARPDYGRDYVNASEGARLDYERRYFPADGGPLDWWQHLQSYQTWSPAERDHHRATAMQCLTRHDHDNDWSQLARENCGACVLNGYQPRYKRDRDPEHDLEKDGPNYSAWARIYVEAGRIIPAKWREAFARQGTAADSSDGVENRAYYDALGRSLVTFGVRFTA